MAVDSSRVFKRCDAIRRGDELVVQSTLRNWPLVLPMPSLLAFALCRICFDGRVGA